MRPCLWGLHRSNSRRECVMPSQSCGSHLLGTVAEQDRALAQRSCAALQQGLDLWRVLVAQLATLRLHPPAGQPTTVLLY